MCEYIEVLGVVFNFKDFAECFIGDPGIKILIIELIMLLSILIRTNKLLHELNVLIQFFLNRCFVLLIALIQSV